MEVSAIDAREAPRAYFSVQTFGGTMRLIIEVPALERHQYQKVTVNEIVGTMDGTLLRHLGFLSVS